MQKKIAFYISDHNMEHALRTVPILQNIVKLEDEIQIFVKSGKEQISLIQSYGDFGGQLHFYEMEMKEKEPEAFGELAVAEEIFLKEEKIGLVVSDICPWIFLAADGLRIKSVLLASYTWAELCDKEEEKEEYLSCYELADRLLIYDLHVPELTGYGVEYELVSMINRPYNMEAIESMTDKMGGPFVFVDLSVDGCEDGKRIEESGNNCEDGKRTEELGNDMEADDRIEPGNVARGIDVSGLSYRFVVTEGTPLNGDNLIVLSKDVKNRQDYVAASRFVITWGTWNRIAEAVLANRKGAFLVKEEIPMSRYMVEMLKERQQGILVEKNILSEEESGFADLEMLLKNLEEFSYSFDYEYYNSDYDLARKILFAYPEKRRRNRS